ncbi:MAG: hypothetical protein ACM3ZF_16325 [Mycobacterium leprae]
MSRASKPLEGEVLRRVAGKPIDAATAFAALADLIDAVSEYGRIREEERTKRRAIAAYEKIELERIRAAEAILSDYFVHVFHERSSTFDALFARLDQAAEADDSKTVSETLGAIVAIA